MEAIKAKSLRRLKSRQPKAPDYVAAIADFTETEDCSPVDAVALNTRCTEIARQFDKTPQEVAKDINRVYTDSYSQ